MLMRQQPITTWINTAIKPQNGWQFSLQQWVKPTTHDKMLMARQTQSLCLTCFDLYLIGQGRVICDSDPIVSMLTFLISSNSMSISLIADVMSWILWSVFWIFVICFRKAKNSWLSEPWSLRNTSSCLMSFKIDVNWDNSSFSFFIIFSLFSCTEALTKTIRDWTRTYVQL